MTLEEINAVIEKRRLRIAGRLNSKYEGFLGFVLSREQLKSFATGFYEEGLEKGKNNDDNLDSK